MDADATNAGGAVMSSAPFSVKLRLDLDPLTGSDTETVAAMIGVFPEQQRPIISTVYHLSDPALNSPYVVLSIVAIGWVARKALGPLLEQVGNCFRDSFIAFRNRRKPSPPGVGLYIIDVENVEVRVSIPADALVTWKDDDGRFKQLADFLAEGFQDVILRRAERVRVLWDPVSKGWQFCDIWPSNMIPTNEYYVYDPRNCKWERRSLAKESGDDSGGI